MQIKTVGVLRNDILRCSWFEAEKTSSQACAQGTFWNIQSIYTLYQSTQKSKITLHCKSKQLHMQYPHASGRIFSLLQY